MLLNERANVTMTAKLPPTHAIRYPTQSSSRPNKQLGGGPAFDSLCCFFLPRIQPMHPECRRGACVRGPEVVGIGQLKQKKRKVSARLRCEESKELYGCQRVDRMFFPARKNLNLKCSCRALMTLKSHARMHPISSRLTVCQRIRQATLISPRLVLAA
jgi:hypothetical protein